MNEPIRILMLFTILNRGGAETMVMNYYRNIDRTKVQFDFVVHRPERGAYEDEIEALGGRIYRMMPLHPLTFGKYKEQIKEFFDHHNEYKIIHGHCSESGYFIYKEAAKRGIPVIIAHAHNSHAMFDGKWFFRTYFKHAMRKYVTDIFTCGEDAAKWLAGKKLSRKATLQKNAIDTLHFSYSKQKRDKIREEFGIEESTLLVGHIGRFEKQKNHKFAIEAFEALLHKQPNARLLLVGSGGCLENETKELVEQKGLKEKICFLGTRKDVECLMSTMDVFLFPSFMEGMSVAMLEAQCAGLRCIVSDRIPREVQMTDLVSFLPLEKGAEYWAEEIIKASQTAHDRTNYPAKIAQAGYDIKINAEWLQNLYIELWQRH